MNAPKNIKWCNVPEGEFMYGNNQETRLSGAYRIGQHPITNAQYGAFVEAGGYMERRYWTDTGWAWRTERHATGPEKYGGVFDQPNHPVVGVTWYEAMAFCRWLSEVSDEEITLPTEAQWEKAARGTDGRRYPWGDEITPRYANYFESGLKATTAVGSYPSGASPYGVLDMAGNVWEWTRSLYDKYSYDAGDNARRVLRGGSFSSNEYGVRCAAPDPLDPDYLFADLGFRVVAERHADR